MLKVLLKKQFLELRYSYFKNKRNNKKTNKLSNIAFGITLVVLYISLCMAFVGLGFFFMDILEPLNMMWLYFSFFAISLIVGGTFVTMFYSTSLLYSAKDNELLLSLPINTKDIILSRMIVLYFNTLIFTSLIWFPATFVYLARCGFNLGILLIGFLLWLVLSLIVLALASLFGYLIAYVSRRFKGRNYISTISAVLFIVVYYYAYFNISKYLNQIANHINEIEVFVKYKLWLFYIVGKASIGDIKALLIIALIGMVCTLWCFTLINNNFGTIIKDINSSAKSKSRKNRFKQSSTKNALIKKELAHFLSNTNYTMNCGLGILLMIVASVALLFYQNKLKEIINIYNQFIPFDKMLPAIILAFVVSITSMGALATPSVSLEGNTYWITRSLPISTYEILEAKRKLQVKLNLFPALIFVLTCSFVFELNNHMVILLVVGTIAFLFFISFWDLFLGVKGANLNWTSEVVPIKQSFNVLIAIFSSFVFMLIIGYGYFVLMDKVKIEYYLSFIIVICLLLGKMIKKWIKTKGVKEYENL